MVKQISVAAGCILALAAILGGIMKYDAQVVKAEDMRPVQQAIQKLNTRIDKSDMKQIARDYQRRIWQLEDRYGKDERAMPPGIRNEHRCLVRDLKATEDQIRTMNK